MQTGLTHYPGQLLICIGCNCRVGGVVHSCTVGRDYHSRRGVVHGQLQHNSKDGHEQMHHQSEPPVLMSAEAQQLNTAAESIRVLQV